MPQYSPRDLQYAAELRQAVHQEALAIVRQSRPHADQVVDRHPVEDYFQQSWEYPGRWYTVVAIPCGYKSRQALVDAIVRDTLAAPDTAERQETRPAEKHTARRETTPPVPPPEHDPFHALLAQYPDLALDYCLVPESAYSGYASHRRALAAAFAALPGDWQGDPARAVGHPIPAESLFSSDYSGERLNYRRAFLYPPHENGYTGKDFARVNAALFPCGTAHLEACQWSTDWSDYFDEGREWWGALCLTVYDSALRRFAVILASATD